MGDECTKTYLKDVLNKAPPGKHYPAPDGGIQEWDAFIATLDKPVVSLEEKI